MRDIVVPTFIIGGAPKSGTTSLYNYLDQHPQVCMSARKETDTFTGDKYKGLEWLSKNYYRHYNGELAIGEGSSSILQDSRSVTRIYNAIPDVKMIFILRNPTERIYSHFTFLQGTQIIDKDVSFSSFIRSRSDRREILIDIGRYYRHLIRFEEHFERSQMLVLLFDDLKADTEKLVERLYKFVGVDPSYRPNLGVNNSTREPRFEDIHFFLTRSWEKMRDYVDVYVANQIRPLRRVVKRLITKKADREPISEGDRTYLKNIYRGPNRKLEGWLGRDLSHWE